MECNFDNNQYFEYERYSKENDVISYEMQTKKFMMMHDENCSIEKRKEIRNELVLANIRLVDYLARKYAYAYDIDINELKSYGYEALIKCIDNYDVNLGNTFSTFAFPRIKGFIMDGASYILGFKHQNYLFSNYILMKEIVEKNSGKRVKNNPELNYIIVDKMVSELGVNKKIANNLLNNLFINSLTVNEACCLVKNAELSAFNHDFVDKMDEILKTLPAKEEQVLRLRFGFFDGECKTLDEIGHLYGICNQTVKNIETRALKKLRSPSRINKVKDYL